MGSIFLSSFRFGDRFFRWSTGAQTNSLNSRSHLTLSRWVGAFVPGPPHETLADVLTGKLSPSPSPCAPFIPACPLRRSTNHENSGRLARCAA